MKCWLLPLAVSTLEFGHPQIYAPPNSLVSVKLINNEHKPIYVGLSLNQTSPQTYNNISPLQSSTHLAPITTNVLHTEADFIDKDGQSTEESHEQLSTDVLSETNEHAILGVVKGNSHLINSAAKESFDCLEHKISDACEPLTRDRIDGAGKYCVPEVEVMASLRMIVLDYSNTFRKCQAEHIKEDMDFVQSKFKVKTWELDRVQIIQQRQRHLRSSQSHKTRLMEAWRMVPAKSYTNFKPIVGLIDTGVDFDKTELEKYIWFNELEIEGTKNVDDDGNGFIDDMLGHTPDAQGYPPIDRDGTGTHNSSMIALSNPNVQIAMCRRFPLSPQKAANRHIHECIAWLVAINAHIIVLPDQFVLSELTHRTALEALSNRLVIISYESIPTKCRPNELISIPPELYVPPELTKLAECSFVSLSATSLASQAALALNVDPFLNGSDLRRLLTTPVNAEADMTDPVRGVKGATDVTDPVKGVKGAADVTDPVKMVEMLRPDRFLKPVDSNNATVSWDEMRFRLRLLHAGQVVSYDFWRGSSEVPQGSQLVAYSVHSGDFNPQAIARLRLDLEQVSSFAFNGTAERLFKTVNVSIKTLTGPLSLVFASFIVYI